MIDITFKEDQYVYKVAVKHKGAVCVDAFELSAALVQAGVNKDNDPTVDQMAAAVRSVGWKDPEGALGEEFTDTELFSVASKVFMRQEQLGNAPGPLQSTRPCTAGPSPASGD